MQRQWRVVLILITLTWWSLTPAAAEKVGHFKDDQGTLHITNVEPEDQAKPPAPPPTGVPIRPLGPQTRVPPAPMPPVQVPHAQPPLAQPPEVVSPSAETAEVPAETIQAPPEAPQVAPPPEAPPDNG